MERMKFETPDMVAGNVEKIGALFPNCITEALDEEKKLFNSANDGKVVKKELENGNRGVIPEFDSQNFDI